MLINSHHDSSTNSTNGTYGMRCIPFLMYYCLSVCPCVCLFVCSVCLFCLFLLFVCLFYLFVCLFVLFVCLSVCLFVCLFVRLFVCSFVCILHPFYYHRTTLALPSSSGSDPGAHSRPSSPLYSRYVPSVVIARRVQLFFFLADSRGIIPTRSRC